MLRGRVIELNLIGSVEQAVHLEQIAHRAEIVRLAIGLDVIRCIATFVSPYGRTTAMPQTQVVSELVKPRAGPGERLSDEFIPESQRDERVAAWQVGNARRARRYVVLQGLEIGVRSEIGVHRAAGLTLLAVVGRRFAVDEAGQ